MLAWACMWAECRRNAEQHPIRWALGVYVLVTLAYFSLADRELLSAHTAGNHYSLLAESWLKGRLDLESGPPAYTHNNDFARHQGRWYVVFPPFPALCLLPVVALAGAAERVADGQFFLWLAGIAPASMLLVLRRARKLGLVEIDALTSVGLVLAYAFGTVYFFSALQGTVWYAAHVVAAGTTAGFLYFALGAARPVMAGSLLALAVATRPPLIWAGLFFLFELWRTTRGPAPEVLRLRVGLRRALWFLLPVALVVVGLGWHNLARFGSITEPGYRFLQVVWQQRIETWGLFSYHYLARNLGALLTSLPYAPRAGATVPFQINGHGLALWFTTPVYVWLLWPRRCKATYAAVLVSALLVALPSWFYQNTGWVQFGQRFSNDYSPFLFLALAMSGLRHRPWFWGLVVWAIIVNGFGAISFNRPDWRAYYYLEPTQAVLYQPD